MPFFEAGTETFIRDYTRTSLRLIVRDSRLREHDPILGIVDLPLQETLRYSSEVTRTYAIQDGSSACGAPLPPAVFTNGSLSQASALERFRSPSSSRVSKSTSRGSSADGTLARSASRSRFASSRSRVPTLIGARRSSFCPRSRRRRSSPSTRLGRMVMRSFTTSTSPSGCQRTTDIRLRSTLTMAVRASKLARSAKPAMPSRLYVSILSPDACF